MNVILYNCSDAYNVVDKDLKDGLTVENVRFFDDGSISVKNPTLKLNVVSDVSELSEYNYISIPKLGSYYYITSMSANGGLIIIETVRDVLMTFKKDIKASTQYVIRQEMKYKNPFLQDGELPIRSDHNYVYEPFQGPDGPVFDKSCINVILETIGRGGTPE